MKKTNVNTTADGQQTHSMGIISKRISNVFPLGRSGPIPPDQSCPEVLQPWIFGTPSDHDAPGQAFALLDAAHIPNLPQLLEASGLQYRCLYSGAVEDNLSELAPYLLELKDGDPFTRNLMTDIPGKPAPWHLWGKEACVFMRAPMDLNAMWRHLRKFTRLQDDNGNWHMVRFWEPYIFWQGVTFGNGLFFELLKPISYAISCREDHALVARAVGDLTLKRKHLGDETRQGLMIIWSIGQLRDFMKTAMKPMLEFYQVDVFELETFCTRVLHWCRRHNILRLQDVSRYCIAHAFLGLGFDADPRAPTAIRTDALRDTFFSNSEGSEALMKTIRRDHSHLLDIKARWATARTALTPNGAFIAKTRAILESEGALIAVRLLVDQLNQLIFGFQYAQNSLVQRRVLIAPKFIDENTLIADLQSQIDMHMEDFS